jgi:aspartate/methionine/tyrosine aminotransferase
MRIDLFAMERMQSLHWHRVKYDLSESGVRPLTVDELLRYAGVDRQPQFLATKLGYPLSEGSEELRELIARWYPGATAANVTVVNGGSEANHLALWSLLEPRGRLAFMIPNYLQGWGLGRHYAGTTDTFALRPSGAGSQRRWALDLDELERCVRRKPRVIMVCNPNNPTGAVLTEAEMDAVVDAARRARAWLVADEIYRGAEVATDRSTSTFWGRYDKVVVTSGLSKAFGLPGLRVGWTVGPARFIEQVWRHHDYTTLTPGMLSDHLARIALEPAIREQILARTRGIIRRNLPPLESWLTRFGAVFDYVPPVAGAIVFAHYRLPIASTRLVEQIRQRCSVLLVPGDQFRAGKGIRFGFGYDIERTMEGLGLVEAELQRVPSKTARGAKARSPRPAAASATTSAPRRAARGIGRARGSRSARRK